MSELYYSNLEAYPVPRVMESIFYGFEPYIQYLLAVIRYKEQDYKSFNVQSLEVPLWKDYPDDFPAEKYPDLQRDTRKGYWVKISDKKLEDNPRLHSSMFEEYFFHIKKPEKHDGRTFWPKENKAIVLFSSEKHNTICLSLKPTGRLYLRPNLYNYRMMRNALFDLQNKPQKYMLPILNLFRNNKSIQWPSFEPERVSQYYILEDVKRSGCEIQRRFVEKALATPDFAILDGPPGTGKTTTICELIMQLIVRRKRVLLVASTHVAVDNVLERLIEDPERERLLFPIRIGKEKDVSENLHKYMYEKFCQTERKRILKFLRELRSPNDAQESLYHVLSKISTNEPGSTNSSEKIVNDLILHSANLVCGTAIGVLQYPPIKHRKMTNNEHSLFDMMIVDESSKTPFHEFIVPALFAERWILVGDPKQLSPYVDRDEVEISIRAILQKNKFDPSDLTMTIPFVRMFQRNRFSLIVTSEDYIDQYLRHFENVKEYIRKDISIASCSGENTDITMDLEWKLWSANLIVLTPDSIKKYTYLLPPDLEVFVDPKLEIDQATFFSKYARQYYGRLVFHRFNPRDERESWIQEMGYRQGRYYEVRKLKEKKDQYHYEISTLYPTWNGEEKHPEREPNKSTERSNNAESKFDKRRMSLENALNRLRKAFFPSIVELLSEGYEIEERIEYQNTLSYGFMKKDLNLRHELLEYQHRMHPKISEFPREHIYDLKSLKDANTVISHRDLTWYTYPPFLWVDIVSKSQRKEKNEEEANAIQGYLKKFEQLLQSRKPPNGKQSWSIAILTFYKAQDRLLRETIRSYFKQSYYRKFRRGNIKVHICTVDSFQGHEADFVFLSMVRSRTTIGFLDSPNRLNVAITRAKYGLCIFGDKKLFERRGTSLLKNLASKAPRRKPFGGEK